MLFPELSLCGYPPRICCFTRACDARCWKVSSGFAMRSTGSPSWWAIPIRRRRHLQLPCRVSDGQHLAHCRKQFLPFRVSMEHYLPLGYANRHRGLELVLVWHCSSAKTSGNHRLPRVRRRWARAHCTSSTAPRTRCAIGAARESSCASACVRVACRLLLGSPGRSGRAGVRWRFVVMDPRAVLSCSAPRRSSSNWSCATSITSMALRQAQGARLVSCRGQGRSSPC